MRRIVQETVKLLDESAGDANLGAISPALPVPRRDAGLALAPAAVTTSSPSSSGAARLASTCALERAPTAMCRYDRFPCAAFREHKRLTGRPASFPHRAGCEHGRAGRRQDPQP